MPRLSVVVAYFAKKTQKNSERLFEKTGNRLPGAVEERVVIREKELIH